MEVQSVDAAFRRALAVNEKRAAEALGDELHIAGTG